MSASALKRRREAVRAAKLALLKIEALQSIDRADASARKVEEALAHVASAITDDLIIPAISRVADDLRQVDAAQSGGRHL